MAKEENINININVEGKSVKELKQDFKDLKNQIAEASDPADIERLSIAAGAVSDKIQDVNEKIKVFAAGSEFEKVGNGLGLIGSQIASLDFEGAAESAKLLSGTLKNINPKELAGGIKSLGSTVLELGKSFVTMGLSLLTNPLFLFAAIITGIVVALVTLKDKIYIVGVAFDFITKPIKIVIQAFKDLTDSIGLTTFAMEEQANAAKDTADKVVDANNAKIAKLEKQYAREINLAKAKGEDTLALEIELQKKIQNLTFNSFNETKKAIAEQERILRSDASNDAKKDASEKLKDLKKSLSDISDANKDAHNKEDALREGRNTETRKKNQEHLNKLKKQNEDAATKAEEKRVAAFLKRKEADKKASDEVHDALIEFGVKRELATKKAQEDEKTKQHDFFIKKLQAEKAYYETSNALKKAAEQARKDDALATVEELFGDAGFGATFKVLSTVLDENFEFTAENLKEIANKTVDALQEIYTFASDFRIQKLNNELDTLESNKQKELAAVGDNEKARADIEKKFADQKFKLEKKIADEKKRQAIINVLIDTAQAIVKTLAAYGGTPIGIGLSVAVAALAAAQIAAINNASKSPQVPNLPNPETGNGTGSANATPTVNLFGSNTPNVNQNVATPSINNNLTIKAVVSETEVTKTQQFVNKVEDSAKI